jgi:four helix bundle protein
MRAEELRDRTKALTMRTIKLFRSLPRTPEAQVIGKQLLRSASSAAANYRAVCRARSNAEFVAKLCIVVEEIDEALFWMEVLVDSETVSKSRMAAIIREASELTAIFSASKKTAQANGRQKR